MTAGRSLLLAAVLAAACAPVPVPLRSAYHPSDADLGVTRIAHGAVLLEMKGTRVVVDPWFHSGFWNRQSEPLGLTPDTLPSLAAVLITHGHGEHFDERALRDLARTVPIAVARPELAGRLGELGFKQVTPLDWWDTTHIGPITVTAIPARHSVPENGYVLDADGVQAYAAGDTRPYPELVDVATRFPKLDVALLPVGGERVLGFERSMGPKDAAEAAAQLSPHRVIPIVYGARGLPPLRWHARHPVERFVAECKERGLGDDRVVVLSPGESWHYYR